MAWLCMPFGDRARNLHRRGLVGCRSRRVWYRFGVSLISSSQYQQQQQLNLPPIALNNPIESRRGISNLTHVNKNEKIVLTQPNAPNCSNHPPANSPPNPSPNPRHNPSHNRHENRHTSNHRQQPHRSTKRTLSLHQLKIQTHILQAQKPACTA